MGLFPPDSDYRDLALPPWWRQVQALNLPLRVGMQVVDILMANRYGEGLLFTIEETRLNSSDESLVLVQSVNRPGSSKGGLAAYFVPNIEHEETRRMLTAEHGAGILFAFF